MAAVLRSRKGKASPAPAPQPRDAMGVGAKLLSQLKEKPLETLGGLGLLPAVVGLGFLALRAREALLGSPDMSYPYQELLSTGVHALGSLLWRGLSVLISDHSVLKGSAWALLPLLLGLVLAARSKRRPAFLLGALTVSALLLVVGSSFYRIALAATSSPDEGPSRWFHCGSGLGATLADRVAFETCSWLVNDTSRNYGRRIDLNGLLGWLLATCLIAVVAGTRAPMASRWHSRPRWALVGVHALLGLLLLHDLPRAYAFGTWGLRYPQAGIQEKCDKALAQAIAAGTCWAYDVSAGAEEKVVFVQGSGCPKGRNGSFVPLGKTAGNECLIILSSLPRVIVHE